MLKFTLQASQYLQEQAEIFNFLLNQLKNPKFGLSGNPTMEDLSRKQLNLSHDVSGNNVQS